MQQVHVFVSGFVQGVNFRYFVKTSAEKLGVTGWVRNLQDGRVEVVMQGSKESIVALLAFCKKGPLRAEVKDIQVKDEAIVERYNDFDVKL